MAPLHIDVWSDISCPWCFIGHRSLRQAVEAEGTPVEIQHHPFLLRPDVPAAGEDLHDMLRHRYHRDPREIFAPAEDAARAIGLALDLGKQPRLFPTTPAHTLLRAAEAHGTQIALLDALFSAYFIDARDIADPALLVDLAVAHGFHADAAARLLEDDAELARTRRDAEQAARQGLRGVPHFVIGGRTWLSGAQPVEGLRAAIARTRA